MSLKSNCRRIIAGNKVRESMREEGILYFFLTI